MGVIAENICNEYYLLDESYKKKYTCIESSDISALKLLISLSDSPDKLNIKPKINNQYYSNCLFHKCDDNPVCIVDSKDKGGKVIFCYGCGHGGSIMNFLSEYFNIELLDSIDILYAFIARNISSLSNNNLEIYNKIFSKYDLINTDEYVLESINKTNNLNNRINEYINLHDYAIDDSVIISKRLCCSDNYVRKLFRDGNNIKKC